MDQSYDLDEVFSSRRKAAELSTHILKEGYGVTLDSILQYIRELENAYMVLHFDYQALERKSNGQ